MFAVVGYYKVKIEGGVLYLNRKIVRDYRRAGAGGPLA
jgi:hypothetical protein